MEQNHDVRAVNYLVKTWNATRLYSRSQNVYVHLAWYDLILMIHFLSV